VILAISHGGDDHLAPVLAELERMSSEVVVVDTATIPSTTAMCADYSGSVDNWRLGLADGSALDLSDCHAGWWRRARACGFDARISDPAHASWAANETYEAMSGFWDVLPIAWVSPPRAVEMAMMKTWQIPTARSVGLDVPRTVVTSAPDEARAFIDRVGLGRVICKAFSATEESWRETRMVGTEEYALLDRVALAPVIFQEFVPAVVDLRITVVGEQVFTTTIHSQELAYPLDFRVYLDRGPGVRMEPATLPAGVADALRRLLKVAGLRYGAIDMRLTPEGRYVFLEVNPVGQWRFVEEVTGQPITTAMAQLLTDLDTA
jgi:MvdD-like protein with pre-ATP grasp domain/ribosomal protein S6-L-glutamate ligase RimK-like protein